MWRDMLGRGLILKLIDAWLLGHTRCPWFESRSRRDETDGGFGLRDRINTLEEHESPGYIHRKRALLSDSAVRELVFHFVELFG
jgi:hypothetical protein